MGLVVTVVPTPSNIYHLYTWSQGGFAKYYPKWWYRKKKSLIFKTNNANSRLFGQLERGCLAWLPRMIFHPYFPGQTIVHGHSPLRSYSPHTFPVRSSLTFFRIVSDKVIRIIDVFYWLWDKLIIIFVTFRLLVISNISSHTDATNTAKSHIQVIAV